MRIKSEGSLVDIPATRGATSSTSKPHLTIGGGSGNELWQYSETTFNDRVPAKVDLKKIKEHCGFLWTIQFLPQTHYWGFLLNWE